MATLREIWWKIYPNEDDHRWMPLIWLPFMVWFFVDPLWEHYGPLGWTINTIAGLAFILFYLQSFSRPEPYRLLSILAMMTMAAVFVPLNGGAIGLSVYAAAAGGFHTNQRRVFLLIALDLCILAYGAYHLKVPLPFWGTMLLLIVLASPSNPTETAKAVPQK